MTFEEVLADWGTATLLSDKHGGAEPVPLRRGDVEYLARRARSTGRLGSIDLYNYRYQSRNSHLAGNTVPWGTHPHEILIPPEAAGEIHILLFDIEDDGIPEPGECRIVGFYWALHNYLRDPDLPLSGISAERLMFFMDWKPAGLVTPHRRF